MIKIIKQASKIINDYAFDKYGIKEDILIYNDTDSVYLTISPILKSLGNPFKSIIKLGLLDRYLNKQENPFICNFTCHCRREICGAGSALQFDGHGVGRNAY